MDPICEEKINYLQKYVPFLANVIELLANDSEKEGKLAQMQLLYDLLNKPDNSVQIETLEKCEEVLSRVFGNGEGKHDEAEIKDRKEENIPNVADCLVKKEVEEDSAVQETEENVTEVCENVNGCSEENTSAETELSSQIEAENVAGTPAAVKDVHMETQPVTDVPEVEPHVANGIEVEHDKSETSKYDEEDLKNSADKKTCDIKEKAIECSAEKKKLSIEGSDLNVETEASEKVTNDDLKEDPPEENSLLVANNDIANEETLAEELGHEVDESETFILPDDGESPKPAVEEVNIDIQETADSQLENFESSTDTEKALEQQSDVITQSQTNILPFKIISAESLAIQSVQSLSQVDVSSDNMEPESTNDSAEKELNVDVREEGDKNDEDLDPLDTMLNTPDELLKTTETAPTSAPAPIENGTASLDQAKTDEKVGDGDDDDVLLIETRSSPIFIDSDPEDEENTKLSRSLPLMPSKPIVAASKPQQKQQKPSARKSTSVVMDTLRHIINRHNVSIRKVSTSSKPKPVRDTGFLLKKDPKALMETISLLDSDSDDETPKRTQSSKSNDDDVIIVSSTKGRIAPIKKTSLVSSSKQITRIPVKLVNKLTGKPTAQSHFLNAVNLQPAPKSSSNPASFSAQLSNKKVIIPNAFYGNPTYNRKAPSSSVVSANVDESSSNDSVQRTSNALPTVGIRQTNDKFLKEWLESFLTNFASPLQIASHACFVLLQRVLKYRFFQRLKETRVNLNTLAKSSVAETMDIQMLLDLRSVFIENDHLTDAGRRFCRFATNEAFGKPVALTTDSRTGKVTCRTRIASNAKTVAAVQKITKPSILGRPTAAAEISPQQRQTQTIATVTSANANPSNVVSAVCYTAKRKSKFRKLSNGTLVADDDDNDYTPNKGDIVPEEEIVTERKKSLRTNRTKRKEAGFTYSEDHDDEEFEALAKKLEDKKREELRLAEERELEREKEWERKTKKTVAKKTTSKRQANNVSKFPDFRHISRPLISEHPLDPMKGPSRKKLRLADTEMLGNADDDLLTPTWVEADGDDGEVDSLLDFADEPQSPESHVSDDDNNVVEQDPVTTVPEDSDNSDTCPSIFDVNTNKSLKNTDRSLHAQNQSFDFCVHCLRRVSRTVHHYVNEHRSSEVFTARLRTRDIRRLLTTSNVGFVHLYKGNQQQYAAHCIFCDKEVKFLYPYWFEHFTMHTGEYSFKCSGCHIRKPTRSLLTNHLQSGAGCPRKGKAVKLHFFDTKSNQIEANVCTLCNYTQLNRKNVLRHLRTQHGLDTIEETHIIKVVLLQVSGPFRDQEEIANDAAQLSLLEQSDDEENGINGDAFDETSLMMQNDFTDNDDLSFMICGMLDVQTNISAETGELLTNADTQNTVDNQ